MTFGHDHRPPDGAAARPSTSTTRADPVRPRPRGRPPRRHRDRPLRAAVPGAGHQGRAADRAHDRAAVPARRPARHRLRGGLHLVAVGVRAGHAAQQVLHPDARPDPRRLRCSARASAIIAWAKKLLPHEVAIQDRHDGPSSRRRTSSSPGATMRQHGRRDWASSAGRCSRRARCCRPARRRRGRGGAAGRRPDQEPAPRTGPAVLLHTPAWTRRTTAASRCAWSARTARPIRPEDVSVGGQMTVFPGIPGGATNKYADSPTLLIHLRERTPTSAGQHRPPQRTRQQRRAACGATSSRTRRSAPTPAARPACTSSRPTGCSARATSRSS